MVKDYVSACVLSTFGVSEEEFANISATMVNYGVEATYSEQDMVGKLKLAKKTVDDVALEKALKTVMAMVGDKVYADEDISLEKKAVEALKQKGMMLAVAESITGGMLSSAICDMEGASEVFYEGTVTYNNASKVRRLHVPAGMIENYTAVSQEVCHAMLQGVLVNKEINIAISTTGYASGMGEMDGLVYIGLGDKKSAHIEEMNFSGERNEIRKKTVNRALFLLIKWLSVTTK